MRKRKIILSLILLFTPVILDAQSISIRVMTMNIKEGGIIADFNTDAFCECIRIYNPDFVVFQEMDNFTTRNGNIDMLSEMAVKLGMFPYFGRAITFASGDFGNAILSKYPFHKARTITSRPSDATESRACSWIDLTLPGNRQVRIAVTHLDVTSDQNRISNLATFNNGLLEDTSIPMLLMGDFNATPGSETMAYAFLKWQDIGSGTAFTIPVTDPTRRIDYVLGYPKNWSKTSYQVVSYPGLSDHCFIVADVQYP